MNSLVNYGSDDDYDDSSDEKPMDSSTSGRLYRKPGSVKQDDVNYDEVQMSLSEDSGDESKTSKEAQRRQSRDGNHRDSARRWDMRDSPKPRDEGRSQRDRNEKREDRSAPAKGERDEDRAKQRESIKEDDRTRDRDRYRGEKDEERSRDRRDERSGKSREKHSRDDRYRDRKDRDRRRSRSPRDRERRRSRSPRRDRSRSRSRDRGNRGGYSRKHERNNKDRFERLGIELPKVEEKTENKDRFFVPGITGRFREQIEKRKLLWQKKEPEVPAQPAAASVPNLSAGGSRTTKVWEATTFAQDTDGKVANKFKRLMGIKNAAEGSNTATDVLKKQEEMFSSMEQQYEVARTATHTMRGVGLGFGSYQR